MISFFSFSVGNRLECLYPQIRQKFAAALTNWYPSDPSAKVILEPWLKVFLQLFIRFCIHNLIFVLFQNIKIGPEILIKILLNVSHLQREHTCLLYKTILLCKTFGHAFLMKVYGWIDVGIWLDGEHLCAEFGIVARWNAFFCSSILRFSPKEQWRPSCYDVSIQN